MSNSMKGNLTHKIYGWYVKFEDGQLPVYRQDLVDIKEEYEGKEVEFEVYLIPNWWHNAYFVKLMDKNFPYKTPFEVEANNKATQDTP
jgi:hypothetical protein